MIGYKHFNNKSQMSVRHASKLSQFQVQKRKNYLEKRPTDSKMNMIPPTVPSALT